MIRIAATLLLASAVGGSDRHVQKTDPAVPAKGEIQVPAPPFTEGLFPCSSCHDNKSQKADPKRRKLAMHDDIVLRHGPETRWCMDCHHLLDRDRLHLVNGEKIPFTVSFQLCGQCHGDKFRDWRVGIHGKRTGSWNGEKQYLLCVHCHDPHAPKFKSVKPMPPPLEPGKIKARKAGAP